MGPIIKAPIIGVPVRVPFRDTVRHPCKGSSKGSFQSCLVGVIYQDPPCTLK